jgi:hypothetical protein
MNIKATLKRCFSRKLQLLGIFILAMATNLMVPGDASWAQLAGMGMAYVALLTYGLDNYDEGFAKGMAVMNRMDS